MPCDLHVHADALIWMRLACLSSCGEVLRLAACPPAHRLRREMILSMLSKRSGGVPAFNNLIRELLSSRMLGVLLLRALAAQDVKQAKALAQQGAAFDYRVQKFHLARLTDGSMDAIATALGQSKHNRVMDLSPRSGQGYLTGNGVVALAGVIKKDRVGAWEKDTTAVIKNDNGGCVEWDKGGCMGKGQR